MTTTLVSSSSFLQDIFADKLLVDDRQPSSWNFQYTLSNESYQVEWYNPKGALYVQFGILFLINMIVATVLGAAIYQTIVIPTKQKQSTSAIMPFLYAFGIYIPICVGLPFWLIDYLDVRSKAVRFGAVGSAATAARIVATLYGFAPSYATYSQTNMMIHFGSLLELKWDDTETNTTTEATKNEAKNSDNGEDNQSSKQQPQQQSQPPPRPLRCSALDIPFVLNHLFHGTLAFALMVALFSWLSPHHYQPFPTEVNATEFHISLEANHLANTFWCAVCLNTFLNVASHIVAAFFPLLLGYEAELLTNNPMFMSSCPSDFWGRRWNSLGHVLLKRGFYKPARKITNSPMMGALSAFVASGIIHEWVSYVMFHSNSHEKLLLEASGDDTYNFPVFGKQMGFFGWNGILVMMEYVVVANGIGKQQRQWMSKHLPRVAVGILVVLTALPTGHWMTGDLVELGFLPHLSLGFPKIVITTLS